MTKYLPLGAEFTSLPYLPCSFLGVARIIAVEHDKNRLVIDKLHNGVTIRDGWKLDATIRAFESGALNWKLDDFTWGYLICALWSSTDEYDNNRRAAKEAGYFVQQSRVLPEGVKYEPLNAEQAKQYARWFYGHPEQGGIVEAPKEGFEFESEAWNAAYEQTCGGCNDTALDANYNIDDFAIGALTDSLVDCLNFQNTQADSLSEYYEKLDRRGHSGTPREFAGHDFWLTRNGHGAGFWDRGLGELGDKLSEAAKVYKGVNITVGDDGKLYI